MGKAFQLQDSPQTFPLLLQRKPLILQFLTSLLQSSDPLSQTGFTNICLPGIELRINPAKPEALIKNAVRCDPDLLLTQLIDIRTLDHISEEEINIGTGAGILGGYFPGQRIRRQIRHICLISLICRMLSDFRASVFLSSSYFCAAPGSFVSSVFLKNFLCIQESRSAGLHIHLLPDFHGSLHPFRLHHQ